MEWRGSAFAPVSFKYEPVTEGDVLGIAFPSVFEASLIVQRKDTIWELSFPLGTVGTPSQKALVGIHPPLLMLPTCDLIYPDAGGIVVRKADASEIHIVASLPASFSLGQMNQDWVQLTDFNSPARFAIHTALGSEDFYQLPESSR